MPINFILYETLVSCIQVWICREFVKHNYLVMYKMSDVHSGVSYGGAFIKDIDPELQYVPQYLVAEGDFVSLYPTIIIQHNISPEVLLMNGDGDGDIDMNYGLPGSASDSQPEWARFNK